MGVVGNEVVYPMVKTDVGQVYSFSILFEYLKWWSHHFLIQEGYGCLTRFLFLIPYGLYAIQKASYMSIIGLVSIWFRMVLSQIIT